MHVLEPALGESDSIPHADLRQSLGEVPPARLSEVGWTIDTLHRRSTVRSR